MGKRRTRAQIQALREAIYKAVSEDRPMTVRQVFYRMVSTGLIDKTENEYKNTVCRLLRDMRERGELPYGWIADSTRWMRKPRTFSSLDDMLRISAEAYRRSLWADQPVYVEVWLEKEALAGVLYEETEKWDVPLMVTRGYPSLSYLHEAAEVIRGYGKPTFLYYFGDYDPSGVDIPRFTEERIREFAPNTEMHFVRVAINPGQISEYGLETRPTKRSDSRSKHFQGESVEVDALPPRTLRKMVREQIHHHIDARALEMLKKIEQEERNLLYQIADDYASDWPW